MFCDLPKVRKLLHGELDPTPLSGLKIPYPASSHFAANNNNKWKAGMEATGTQSSCSLPWLKIMTAFYLPIAPLSLLWSPLSVDRVTETVIGKTAPAILYSIQSRVVQLP